MVTVVVSLAVLLSVIGFVVYIALTNDDQSVASSFDSILVAKMLGGIGWLVNIMSAVLFYPILGFPVLVLWLIAGGIFFTIRLGLVNIRLFKHALAVVRGKFTKADDPGEITHFQALTAAVSATVGLGNIAGVAIAVSIGGPGAVVWMMLAGFLGMSTKFAEVTLGLKYRKIDENGRVSGGAFHYLTEGLKERNLPRLGKVLAIIFAVFCIAGSLASGNMFQSNQAISIFTDSFSAVKSYDWAFALLLATAVGVVLIGGIKRIALVAEAVVPLMAFIYITAALVVIIAHASHIPDAIAFMFEDAWTGTAAGGGMIGAIINGFKRAAFSNEAGLGSAPIAHSAAKTKEPAREGCVALLEPFLDTMVICFITGLVITVTGVYEDNSSGNIEGVLLTSRAFATVIDWFPYVLSFAVLLFAYSTMITWSYYGERAWNFLFGPRLIGVYQIGFCVMTFLGGVLDGDDIGLIVDISDLALLSMAVPNLIGLYLMSGVIRQEMISYTQRLKRGEFHKT